MASTMTTIAFMLLSALAANAANLRSNRSVGKVTCAQGWTLYAGHERGGEGHCYKRQNAAVNYSDARTACGLLGHTSVNPKQSYLAVPNSAAENTFLATTMNPNEAGSDAFIWIGFDYSNGQKWEDGSNSDATSSWRVLYSQEDANHKADETGAMPVVFMRSDGGWAFAAKTPINQYICEAAGIPVRSHNEWFESSEKMPNT